MKHIVVYIRPTARLTVKLLHDAGSDCLLNNSSILNVFSVRKHAYSNILKILPQKNENF